MIAQQQHRMARAVRAALARPLSAAGALTLALACGVPGRGDAAGLTMHGGTYGPPGPTNRQAVDYVLIDRHATLNGGFTNAAVGTIAGTPTESGIGIYGSTLDGVLTNRGTIGSVGVPTFGMEIWDSTLTGGLRNAGSIATQYTGIVVNNTALAGGIVNSGTITSAWSGIAVTGDALAGGITNSGDILATNSGSAPTTNRGIAVDVAAVTGGIGNSGHITGGLTGIAVNAGTFAGGIANSGSIVSAGNAGLRIYADTFAGGLSTAGTVTASRDTGIYIDIGSFDGGLTNSGNITGARHGIHLQGGSVTGGIRNAGSITSQWNALDLNVSTLAGGITNAGSMAVAGTGLNVVADRFGGGISNSGSIVSGADGIAVSGSSFVGGIGNSGRIASELTGIAVNAGTFAGGIANSGKIASARDGILLQGGSVTGGISNSGSIVSGASGIAVSGSSLAGGITNSGTIRSDGESGIGVAVQTFANGISNTGSITGATAGIQVVADSFGGGIANRGSLTGSVGDGIAVTSRVFTGPIVNAGQITAPTGVGIRVATTLADGIVNTGTIRGGRAAIDTRAATGPTVINLNGGAIEGNINLSPTFGDTINVTAGTMTGNIVATGAADDRVNFILNGRAFTFTGNIAGVDLVFVDPGTLYLNGNVSGVTAVNVAANTTLVLGPTANVTTLNYRQDPTATLGFTQAANGSFGVIHAGSVTLAGDLVLPVPSRNGLYAPTLLMNYGTVMTWSARSGTFNPLSTRSIFLNRTLAYGATALSAQTTRLPFNTVPSNLRGNAYAVASGLEAAYPAAYNRMDADAITFYAPLFGYSVGQYNQFLEAVSGASYATTLQASLFNAQLLNTVVDQRLAGGDGALGVTNLDRDRAPRAAGARALWATVLGSGASGRGDINAPGFNQETGGIALGADYRLNAQGLIGLLAGYQDGRISFDNRGSTDTTSWQLGAYGQYTTDRWYGNGLATFGWNGYDSKREIALSNTATRALGHYDGTALVLYGEGGYRLPAGPATIRPLLGLGYVKGDTGSFTESAGGVYRLHVQGASGDSFTGNLGVRAELAYQAAAGQRITGEARAIWQHEFLADQQSIDARFAALPGSDFRVVGSRFARDSAVLGMGVKARVAAHTEVSLNYDARVDSDYTANSLFAAVRMDW